MHWKSSWIQDVYTIIIDYKAKLPTAIIVMTILNSYRHLTSHHPIINRIVPIKPIIILIIKKKISQRPNNPQT